MLIPFNLIRSIFLHDRMGSTKFIAGRKVSDHVANKPIPFYQHCPGFVQQVRLFWRTVQVGRHNGHYTCRKRAYSALN